MRHGTFFSTLPCYLTELEKSQRGREAADIHEQLMTHEYEMAERAKADKKEQKRLKRLMAKAANASHTGVEERDVECYESPDRSHYRIETIRCDTGEAIHGRPMDPKERENIDQLSMFPDHMVSRAVRAAHAQEADPRRTVEDFARTTREAGHRIDIPTARPADPPPPSEAEPAAEPKRRRHPRAKAPDVGSVENPAPLPPVQEVNPDEEPPPEPEESDEGEEDDVDEEEDEDEEIDG